MITVGNAKGLMAIWYKWGNSKEWSRKIQVLNSCILCSAWCRIYPTSLGYIGIFNGQNLCLKHLKYADYIQLLIAINAWNMCLITLVIYAKDENYYLLLRTYIYHSYSLMKLCKYTLCYCVILYLTSNNKHYL